MSIRTRNFILESTDNIKMESASEVHDGKELDTKIAILSTGTLCWVAGEDREKFITELEQLISKYRI